MNGDKEKGKTSYKNSEKREFSAEIREVLGEAYAPYGKKKQGEYTLKDFYEWPEDERIELIDGYIFVMNSPSLHHQDIAGEVYYQLRNQLDRREGPCKPLISPLDVQLDCDEYTMVEPDVIILCDPEKKRRWGIYGAPEFLLEVLSPSTRKKDIILKTEKYRRAGVKEYWMIDPDRKSLIVYDFRDEENLLPRVLPLEGEAGLALYEGEVRIDLDAVRALLVELPE